MLSKFLKETKMRFERKIFSTFSELRDLENDFVSFLEVNRVPSDVIYDLKIALHEYILNVMEHGYHWAPDGIIEVAVDVDFDRSKKFNIEVEIRDYAPKFVIYKEKIMKEVNNRSFRGRGLVMILTFVDDIIYDHELKDGNRVKFVKSVKL